MTSVITRAAWAYSPLRVWDDTDEAEWAFSGISIAVRLTRGDVERNTWPHDVIAVGGLRHPLAFEDEDLVLKGVLMRLEDGSGLELNHAQGEMGRAFRLADNPADGLVLADRLLGNVSIVTA